MSATEQAAQPDSERNDINLAGWLLIKLQNGYIVGDWTLFTAPLKSMCSRCSYNIAKSFHPH